MQSVNWLSAYKEEQDNSLIVVLAELPREIMMLVASIAAARCIAM
jgi:hypothetical protein